MFPENLWSILHGVKKMPSNKIDIVSVRLVKESKLISPEPINSPEDAVKVIGEEMMQLDREAICVVNLNTRNKPISCSFVSLGVVDAAITTPREVFRQAILSDAKSVILMHNHPSGDITPSIDDIKFTDTLCKAGSIINIPVMDHVIVAPDAEKYYSFRERGMMETMSRDLLEAKDQWPEEENKLSVGDRAAVDDKVREITERLESGIKELYESDKYREYLDTLSKFYHYSPSNCLLIALQKPDATYVAGFRAWHDKFERNVNKGETAIRILAPMNYKYEKDVIKLDENGREYTERETITGTRFKVSYVFDVSQTTGKALPEIAAALHGSVKDYDRVFAAISDVSPAPVRFEDIDNGANGYYSLNTKEIVLKNGMSQEQTIKTLLHETAHAILHDSDTGVEKDALPDRHTKEVEAESVAYTVCKHFNLDTSDYSFGYIAGWSGDKDMSELKASLNTIRNVSADLIERIDERVKELGRDSLEMITENEKQLSRNHSLEGTVMESEMERCR